MGLCYKSLNILSIANMFFSSLAPALGMFQCSLQALYVPQEVAVDSSFQNRQDFDQAKLERNIMPPQSSSR